MEGIVLIRGSGDIASGVAYRLKRCGFKVIMTDIEKPTFIRRTVCFGEAIYEGSTVVEGIKAVKAEGYEEIIYIIKNDMIPVIVDDSLALLKYLKPGVLVDAIIAKKNLGTIKGMADLVIGLGPGFEAGKDVDMVVETNRGHNLGRVIENGLAEANTGMPGNIAGYGDERIIRAPGDGIVKHNFDIGDIVNKGEVIGLSGNIPIVSPLSGVIRGFIREGLYVSKGFKIGDVDPRGIREHCCKISDKALAVAGGVLEAIMMFEHLKFERKAI